MNGAPARGRQRAAAMPPEREGLESVVCRQSSVEWIATATVRPPSALRASPPNIAEHPCAHIVGP
jgi:hypothetical protein